jgi:quinol-cytochrome oxidoreductase complex cytochrome b subunit/coenzyme F420-reducing hydrogenase delta subunit
MKNESPAKDADGHVTYQKIAGFFSPVFSSRYNPLYHLGDISVYLFTIACISGIWVFLFYNVDPAQAYDSVEAISSNVFNGWMRTIHRYSSDLLVIFIIIHLIQSIITGKFKRVISWVSGIISFLIVLFIGVTGFILVWDQKAKLAGYLTARLFSGLPLFDPAIAGAFLLNDLEYVGGFFRVALFGHIFFSVATVILLWVHVMRLTKPKLFPARVLMLHIFAALAVVSAFFPVQSDAPAQNSFLPDAASFDWYYYFGFYLMKVFSVNWNWILLIGSGTALAMVPFFFKKKKKAPAVVDLEICDGCKVCSYDCPYGAIDMLVRGDQIKAILNPEKCVSCGICIGSCKEDAITMDGYPDMLKAAGQEKKDIAVISCQYSSNFKMPEAVNAHHYQVPCIGSVAPKDVQNILEGSAEGVLMLGCEDCYYRHGKNWGADRFSRKRVPMLSRRSDAGRIKLVTFNSFRNDTIGNFVNEIKASEEKNFTVKDHTRIKHLPSLLIILAFFLAMVPLSSTPVSFFDPHEKKLVLNFTYISSPTKTKTLSGGDLQHMQTKTAMITERSPVMIRITSSQNKLLFEKEFQPRGWRKDIAMFIYSELILEEENITIELEETAFPGKKIVLSNMSINPKGGTFVVMKEGKMVKAEL